MNLYYSEMQGLQSVAGCFGVVQGVARCCQKDRHTVVITLSSHCVAECCRALQRVAARCRRR